MKRITISKRGLASVLAIPLVALGLTACSSANADPFDLSGDIAKMSCDKPWVEVANTISRLDSASAPGERNQLRQWKLNPDDKSELEQVRNALQAKTLECAKTATPSSTSTTMASPSSSSSSSTTSASQFVIKLPKRDGNRLNADGVDADKRGNADAFRKQIAEQAKHDPLTLYVYYMASPLGQAEPLANESVLAKDGKIVDGNVYSSKGEQVYKDWLAMWDSPLTKISAVKEIKWQGANTGVTGTSVSQSDGVGGDDKSGYDVTYVDAQGKTVGAHSALNRCTQPTLPRPSKHIPEGGTDNPEKPKPTSTPTPTKPPTPTCVEIPNNGIVDCGGAKVESKEPQRQGNVPTPVQGPGPGLPETTAKPPAVPRPKPTSTYTPPPAPKPTTTSRPTPPPPVETSAPPTSKPEPPPTVDPCTVNPDFC